MIELEIDMESILTELDGIILVDKNYKLFPIKFIPNRLSRLVRDTCGKPSCGKCGHTAAYISDVTYCPNCGAQFFVDTLARVGFRGQVQQIEQEDYK